MYRVLGYAAALKQMRDSGRNFVIRTGKGVFYASRLNAPVPMLTVEARTTSAGMDPKTARKYLRDRRLPSEMRQKHTWRTRLDPFADVWEQIGNSSPWSRVYK